MMVQSLEDQAEQKGDNTAKRCAHDHIRGIMNAEIEPGKAYCYCQHQGIPSDKEGDERTGKIKKCCCRCKGRNGMARRHGKTVRATDQQPEPLNYLAGPNPSENRLQQIGKRICQKEGADRDQHDQERTR